ncbi:stalk domain-containing protein [Tissierella pigra]|uniref:M28 family peptidase n=1 Tax=Tissierella pigra TaxID=2607614 RepID=A0A6N7XZF6_9FIRM|nr:stalk domain-containing protein [Tissierella pigra]MSU03227.1 M28 family peptidase [Tissierella pigra]
MLKKTIFTALSIALVFLMTVTVNANAEKEIKIIVNGVELKAETEAIIIDNRIMVPFRAIFEALEVNVDWIPDTETIIGEKSDLIMELQSNNKIAKINGKEVELDVAVKVIDGRTLVPIRFVAEEMKAKVDWDQSTRTVTIAADSNIYENDNKNIVNTVGEASSENIINTIKHLTTQPRIVGSEFEREVAIFYADILKSYGYEVELQRFPFKTLSIDEILSINKNKSLDFNYTTFNGTGTNVIARKPANLNSNADILVISAHYDSESITNGVIDNATGVAAVMELANMLQEVSLDTEIRFILFSGEENFMYGSRYYVSKLKKDELERINNINIDSIGEEGDLYPIIGTFNGKANELTYLFDEYLNNQSLEIKKGPPSDYIAFEYAGCPAVTIAQYPSMLLTNIGGLISGDKIERIDIQKIKEITDMLYAIIVENFLRK